MNQKDWVKILGLPLWSQRSYNQQVAVSVSSCVEREKSQLSPESLNGKWAPDCPAENSFTQGAVTNQQLLKSPSGNDTEPMDPLFLCTVAQYEGLISELRAHWQVRGPGCSLQSVGVLSWRAHWQVRGPGRALQSGRSVAARRWKATTQIHALAPRFQKPKL